MNDFSVEELYDCTFGEFCRQTYTTPEIYVRTAEAEIRMLKQARRRYLERYRSMSRQDSERDRIERLILEIERRIKHKNAKLLKYKKEAQNERCAS